MALLPADRVMVTVDKTTKALPQAVVDTLPIVDIQAGTGITFDQVGNVVTISSTATSGGGSGGETPTASTADLDKLMGA